MTLTTFDKQSNARRTAVESKSNRSVTSRVTTPNTRERPPTPTP